MMTLQKFQSLLERGYSLDHIFLLQNDPSEASATLPPKGLALLQALFRKGLIDEKNTITEQGKQLLEFVNNEEIELIKPVAKPKIVEGLNSLHGKLEGRLSALTGKKQMRVDVLGKKYPFLCNEQDLIARVKKVMIKYKLSDYQPIENCLLGYIESCHKGNKWAPLIQYYIIRSKEGVETSQMVTDMKSYIPQESRESGGFEI